MGRTRSHSAQIAHLVPDEVLLLIFAGLMSLARPDALLRCGGVCKHWRTLVSTPSLWRVLDFSRCLRLRHKEGENLWMSVTGHVIVAVCRRFSSVRELNPGMWPFSPIGEKYPFDMPLFLEMLSSTPHLAVLKCRAGVDWLFHYKGVLALLLPEAAVVVAAVRPHPYTTAGLVPAVVAALCNAQMEGGYTALMTACMVNNAPLVAALLALPGAPVNAQLDRSGIDTALKLASLRGYDECVALLLAAQGINVNLASDGGGATALMCASFAGHANAVRRLLAVPGIEVNMHGSVSDQSGRMSGTALEMSNRKGWPEIAALLRAAGAV